MQRSSTILIIATIGFVSASAMVTASEKRQKRAEKQAVHFKEITRNGSVSIIGHFGIPIGQIVKLEGKRARHLKTTNQRTLKFTKVNGVATPDLDRQTSNPPHIQIENIKELPENELIILKGYESLRWRGNPMINWHVDVFFVVTKVLSPADLETED